MRWILGFAISCAGLLAFIYLAMWVFNGFHGVGLDFAGTVALTLGTVFAAGLGVTLMGLVFYSDRGGFDDRANSARNDADRLPH